MFRELSHGFFAFFLWIMLILVWFERSLHPAQLSREWSLTTKTNYITSGRRDVDLHERLQAAQGRMGQISWFSFKLKKNNFWWQKKCFYPSRKPLKCDDSTNSYWAICYYHNVCYSTHKVFLIFGYGCFLTAKTAAVHMVSISSSAHDWIAIFCLLFGRKSLMYKPIPQGPVVRTRVSTNPGLHFNPGFFIFLSKALSRIIFSILFRVSKYQIVGKENLTEFAF